MQDLESISHEGTLQTVLAVQQTIYRTGAVEGSFD